MAELPLGISLSTKYVLTGPDGTRAVFNEPSDADYVGAITEITGLDSPEIRESAENLSGLDGGVHGNFYLGRRPITLSGMIYNVVSAEDRNKKITKIQQASAALREDATLEWTPAGGEAVYIKVRRQQPLRATGSWTKTFQLLLVAADPRIYSVATQEAVTSFPGTGGETTVGTTPYYVCVSPDGKSLYVTEKEGKKVFQFKRLSTGFIEPMATASVEGTFNSGKMVISSDGKWAFSIPNVPNKGAGEGGKEFNIFSRNTSTGELTFVKTQATFSTDIHDIAISPDGKLLYIACLKGKMLVGYSRSEGTLTYLGSITLTTEPEMIQVTPDGKFLIVVVEPSTVKTYLPKESGEILTLVGTFTTTPAKAIAAMAISQDSKTAYFTFVAGTELAAVPRNVETGIMGTELTPVYSMTTNATSTSALIVSPNNATVYSFNEQEISQAVRDGEGRLTALSPGNSLRPKPLQPAVNAVCSPDGKSVYFIATNVVLNMGRTTKGNLLYVATNKLACVNKGSYEVFAVVTFKGALEEPAVFDYTTGQAVIFESLNLQPNDLLVVDMLNHTAVLNGYTSKYGSINFYGSEWFTLKPGENDIRASATFWGSAASITLKWRSGWI
jgi:DNA-binding beta-propeller fold protein YncE